MSKEFEEAIRQTPKKTEELFRILNDLKLKIIVVDGATGGAFLAKGLTVPGSTNCFSEGYIVKDRDTALTRLKEIKESGKEYVVIGILKTGHGSYETMYSIPGMDTIVIDDEYPKPEIDGFVTTFFRHVGDKDPNELDKYVSKVTLENLLYLLKPQMLYSREYKQSKKTKFNSKILLENMKYVLNLRTWLNIGSEQIGIREIKPVEKFKDELVYQAGVFVNELNERSWTVATAESFTGGAVISAITDISESGSVYHDAFVVYDNVAKNQLLSIPFEVLDNGGVYSLDTVFLGAKGLYEKTKANVCIVTSGVGEVADTREGYNKTKPGTIFAGIYIEGKYHAIELDLPVTNKTTRNELKNQATVEIFKYILANLPKVEGSE